MKDITPSLSVGSRAEARWASFPVVFVVDPYAAAWSSTPAAAPWSPASPRRDAC